ncbi:MAG: PEP-CTERM sorting domain-containing protein [Gemmataceae bacterium]|nr:PEP-CTERM sorting domain-containing protein [Gemmataceae bacterium]
MRTVALCLAVTVAASTGPAARAAFIPFANPTAEYTGSTTKIPITDPFRTVLGSIGDGTLAVTFSGPTTVTQVGPGIFGWANPPVVESNAPPVLFSQFQLSRELTFSVPLVTFGVEMQSNNSTNPFFNPTYRLSATFYSGDQVAGTISRDLKAPGGARLFAATTTDEPFTKVVLTSSRGSGGFNFGQVRYEAQAVPEPASLGLLGAGGLGLLAARLRRKTI